MSTRPISILAQLPESYTERITEQLPQARVRTIPSKGPLSEDVEGEVLLTRARGTPNLPLVLERGVRWVHAFGTGVNRFPFAALGGLPLTCSRGASAIPISEWVLAMMLSVAKEIPAAFIKRPPERWPARELGTLYGRTVGLVGFGAIGQAVAVRALAFGMRVLAYRRTERPSPVPDVQLVRDLGSLLHSCDHLVLAAPATEETTRLLNAESLAMVKPGLHLINIARGELIDQEALRHALDDGRVALASLDVVEPEPLPEGHWLYTHPKVRLSAHTSWSSPESVNRHIDMFVDNIRRYLTGQPLTYLVDTELGY